jgi:hypothetical protein
MMGIVYGFGMSLTRVAQGGHFTSDVLWSGGIMYLVAAILARILLTEDSTDTTRLQLGDIRSSNFTPQPRGPARNGEANALACVAGSCASA